MTSPSDQRRQARSAYIFKRCSLRLISLDIGVSQRTVSRWKQEAKANGDDWDVARRASLISGEGTEDLIAYVAEEFALLARHLIEDLKKDQDAPIDKRVAMLTSLADALNKTANSAGRLAPKISELGVAQDMVRRLMEFTRDTFPQHADVLLEIVEPFGETLVEVYG
ncbi:MAG: DUF1804 family protein [Hyphomicrobiales bacterium]|nr:DUF1804 family protein [Hyphomicrobiales bacterium]